MRFPSRLPLILGAGLLLGPSPLPADDQPGAKHEISEARLDELEKQSGRSDEDVLELALAHDEREEARQARALYAEASARGVAVADLRLGWLYESGQGGEQSYEEALRYYEKALAAGVAEANLRIGLLHLEGWGVPRSRTKAVDFIRRAAEAGYKPAQKILSMMYFSGTGVGTNLRLAEHWAEQAAKEDDAEAQALAGDIRNRAARLPGDIKAAREWYELSAEAEYTAGMRGMASTFLRPGASESDAKIGVHWLELAFENGDRMAGFYLAGYHLWFSSATNAESEERLGREILQKSSALGELAAMEVLELEKEGMGLLPAFQYVMHAPVEERYIKRLADLAAEREANPSADAMPRPLKIVQPIYPAALKLDNLEGKAQVEFVVDRTGRVVQARVVSASHPGFAESALAAIKNWRFRPGAKAGRPVNTLVQVPFEFRLNGIPALAIDRFRKNPG